MKKFKFTLHHKSGADFKKSVLLLTIAVILVASGIFWVESQFSVSTDDAYINANVVQIAPRVSGQVTNLYVKNNQYVKENQPLFDVDAEPYQIAVDQAQAKLQMAQAQLEISQLTESRTLELVKKKFASTESGDQAQSAVQVLAATIQYEQANLAKAKLNLQYTKIVAPASGWITNLTLRVGDNVTQNQPIFALIGDKEFWVDSNFKETDMAHIHAGQRADITVDMYHGRTFSGVVESISGGSGTAFSLLPPENATGNWVKVAQRVPVRVHVLSPDMKYPLRVGTSANVTIHINSFKN